MNDLLLPTYLGHDCILDTDKYMRFSGAQISETLDVFETFTTGLIPKDLLRKVKRKNEIFSS
jgi:hypothetical protein